MKKLLLIGLLIVGCEAVLESLKEGCTDSSACNYGTDAGTDGGSCLENDCANICGAFLFIFLFCPNIRTQY